MIEEGAGIIGISISIMKCLIVADLHYSLKQFDWVNLAAEKFDLVVIAGDLLDISSTVEIETQILVVLKYLRRIQPKARLLVSSGNHDGNARNAAGESVASWLDKARDLGALGDGDTLEEEGILFTICPWWDGPETQAGVAMQFERDAARRNGKWIWIYHAPPDASKTSWTGKVHFGDSELPGWIEKYRPDMVFSGHVHQAPFRNGGSWVEKVGSTVVFNAGRQLGSPPAFIAVDTDADTACWFSQMANERIHLDRPEEKTDLAAG